MKLRIPRLSPWYIVNELCSCAIFISEVTKNCADFRILNMSEPPALGKEQAPLRGLSVGSPGWPAHKAMWPHPHTMQWRKITKKYKKKYSTPFELSQTRCEWGCIKPPGRQLRLSGCQQAGGGIRSLSRLLLLIPCIQPALASSLAPRVWVHRTRTPTCFILSKHRGCVPTRPFPTFQSPVLAENHLPP